MCGIFGYTLDTKRADKAFPLTKREKLVVALAVGNTRRGGHAWGAYTCCNGAESELVKGIGPMAMVPGLSTLALAHTLMAHTRYATTGAVTEDNAHPFHVGNIVGAHNGMIYNHASMATKYDRKCEVDSMHLFHHIDEGKSFDEFEGYGAIEYVRTDGNTDEVFLCRMQGGELAIYGLGPREKPYGVVWSSSEAHLLAALKAAGVKGFPYSVKTGRVYSASPNGTLYRTDTEYNLSGRRQVSAADLARTRGNAAMERTSFRFGYSPTVGLVMRRQEGRGKQWKTNTAGAPTKGGVLTMRERGSGPIQGVNEDVVEKPAKSVGPDLVEDRDLFMQPDEDDLREFQQAVRDGRVC